MLLTLATDTLRLGIWLVLLAAVFVPLERLFALRPARLWRTGLGPDLGYYFLNSLLPGLVLGLPLAFLATVAHDLTPGTVREAVAAWPWFARFAAGLLVGEIGAYWAHRMTHRVPFLWQFHAVHHAPEHLDWLVNTRTHPADMVFTRLCALAPIALLGLGGPSNTSVPVAILVAGALWGFVVHANLAWRFGPTRAARIDACLPPLAPHPRGPARPQLLAHAAMDRPAVRHFSPPARRMAGGIRSGTCPRYSGDARMNRTAIILSGALIAGAAGAGWYAAQPGPPIQRIEHLEATGDLRAAQVELRNLVRAAPDDAGLHLRMAHLQMKLADPVAAEKEFQAAIDHGGDRWSILPALAEAMLAQSRYADTLALLPEAGPTPNATTGLLLLRSIAQLGMQDLGAAEQTGAAAEAAAPGSADAVLIAARLAAARGDLGATRGHIEQVLTLDPARVEALLMHERLLTAAGDRPGALAAADRAVRAAPWSAQARIARANQSLYAGQDDAAQADVRAVLAAQPRFTEAVYLNAVLMARHGRTADAASELTRLESANFAPAVYYQAMTALQLGRLESAAVFARRYVALSPADPDGHRLLARAELALKRPDQAVAALQRAVQAAPHDPVTLGMLGQTFGTLGQTSEALAAYERAVHEAPDDPAALTALGIAQAKAGHPRDAMTSLERALTLAPGAQDARAALVGAALDADEIERAAAALKRLQQEAGPTEPAMLLAGLLRLRQGDVPEAQRAFAAVLQAHPESDAARLSLAGTHMLRGERQAGLDLMITVLAHNPANLAALNAAIPAMLAEGRMTDAIEALKAARRAEPRQLLLAAMLADAYLLGGQPAQAVAVLEDARDARTNPPGLLALLARAQTAAGKADDAVATSRALLAAWPGNLQAMTAIVVDAQRDGLTAALDMAATLRRDEANMPMAGALKGDALMRAGHGDDAANAYAAEQAIKPSTALALRQAAAHAAASRDDQAAKVLRAWLSSDPGSVETAQMLAQLDVKAKRWDDAQAHLGTVLAARPDDAMALNNLAWVYASIGDARARGTAQRAYLLAPTADASDTLGWVMVQEGEAGRALPLLERARNIRPDAPGIRYHLGVAMMKHARSDEGSALLRALLAGPEPFEERQAAQAFMDAALDTR